MRKREKETDDQIEREKDRRGMNRDGKNFRKKEEKKGNGGRENGGEKVNLKRNRDEKIEKRGEEIEKSKENLEERGREKKDGFIPTENFFPSCCKKNGRM